MDVGHFRQHRLREQIFHRLAERLFFRLRIVNFRLDHLLLGHLRHLRQRDEQPLQGGRRQGQVFLLPVQTAGKVAQRDGGIVNFYVDVMQRHPAQGDGIRRGEIQRAAIFFFNRRRRRHLAGIDRHIDIAQRKIVDAQAAVPQAAQLEAEVELASGDRHARLLKAHVLQRQIAPAAGRFADLQPRNPAVGGFDHQMQASGGPHQESYRPQQQHKKNQYAEAYLLP